MSQIDFAHFSSAAYNNPPEKELIVEEGSVHCVDKDYFDGDPEEKVAEIRRNTWKIFKKIVAEKFKNNAKILEHANQVYNFQHQWVNITAESPLPFVSRYVEVFGLAAYNHALDLNSIADLTPREIKKLMSKSSANHYIGPLIPPESLHGGVREPYQYLIHDPFPQDQTRANLSRGMEDLRHHPHAYKQRLAMAMVGHIMGGELIPVPTWPDGIDYYRALTPIADEGLYAVPLVAASKFSSLPPLLLFRQTQFSLGALDAVKTWLSNLEEHNGKQGYVTCKDRLEALMKNPEFRRYPEEKITVLAYSLGNTQAGYFLRDYYQHIEEMDLFNGVSNSDGQVIEEAAEKINAMDSKATPPSIYIYRAMTSQDGKNGADYADHIGKKHIGWGIEHPNAVVLLTQVYLQRPAPKNFKERMELHSCRFLEDPNYKTKYKIKVIRGEQLNIELDNTKRGEAVAFFENMRQKIGVRFLYDFINLIYSVLKFIFRLFNINIFNTSR